MRIVTALVLAASAAVAVAATPGKPPPPSRLSLVQAQCAGPPVGPCSAAFGFTSGTAILTGEKEPKPACHDPDRPKGGEVRLTGVVKNGAPFSGTLHTSVYFKATFGQDANGNCVLAGLQLSSVESLTGDLACRNGKCKGELRGAACLPGNCADALITTEFSSFTVFDDAGKALATPGTFVPPAKADVQ
jgi:hypothetical protein